MFLFSIIYLAYFFPELSIDQIFFTLSMPIKGSNTSIIVWAIIAIFIAPLAMGALNYTLLKINKNLYCFIYKISFRIFPLNFKYCKSLLLIFFILAFGFFNNKLDIIDFIKVSTHINTTFYETHYIDPRKVTFTFPKKKKNLILIYLESMEADLAKYAHKTENIIPELTEIAESNISFSNSEDLGGQKQVFGTGWSLASICCTILGIPLTLPIDGYSYENTTHFFNGAYGLGDLLADNGYNLSFMLGADSDFGGLRTLLKTHGNVDLKSLDYFQKTGKVPENYFVWWGIEDKKMIKFAQEELIKLGNENKPFMFSIFLEDTHSPSGYFCEDCEDKYKKHVHNVYRCMSKRVDKFLSWIKEQDFYENSVVIILGDHLYMGFGLYDKKVPERHAYNAFINTGLSAQYSKNRQFTTFDFFPCIVDSLGIKYDAKGLALGRSLFKGEATLLEQMGEKELNKNISSRSNFYIHELLNKK